MQTRAQGCVYQSVFTHIYITSVMDGRSIHSSSMFSSLLSSTQCVLQLRGFVGRLRAAAKIIESVSPSTKLSAQRMSIRVALTLLRLFQTGNGWQDRHQCLRYHNRAVTHLTRMLNHIQNYLRRNRTLSRVSNVRKKNVWNNQGVKKSAHFCD